MANHAKVLNGIIILITCLCEIKGYNFNASPWYTDRYRRETSCAKHEYRCDNSGCISATGLCDGIAQCEDGSDETNKVCGVLLRTERDTSHTQQAMSTQSSYPGACSLPNYPENGYWNVLGNNSSFNPGTWLKPNAIILFECNKNYKLYPEVGSQLLRMCNNGSWGGNSPQCIKTCSSLSNERVEVSCKYKGWMTSCENPYAGTSVEIRCKAFHSDPLVRDSTTRYCRDGTWNSKIPICEPECGVKSVNPTKLIVNGKNVENSEYPWHAGIYLNKVQICGGTIISTKLILTAAHCFESSNWNDYQVGTGKFYRVYGHINDTYSAQYSDIQEVKIQEEFNDGAYLAFDIAVVVLAKTLKITFYVRPICLDRKLFNEPSLANANGIVTGWGYTTETGRASETLKKLEVKYFATADCQQILPVDFKIYYTPYVPDKLCVGVLKKNQSACKGDSGEGLAFKDGDRYYIRGIVSIGPFKNNSACDASLPTLYTSVQFHRDYILHELAKYRFQQYDVATWVANTTDRLKYTGPTKCFLPEHPKNGKWFFPSKTAYTEVPGEEVNENTAIQFECDVGYKLWPEINETYSIRVCRKSKWGFYIPECLKTCESRASTDRLIITCDLDGSRTTCINPYIGTIAQMECATYYQNPSFKDPSKRKQYCLDTGWEDQLPKCEPECGITSIQPKRLLIGGNETKAGDYPWQVAIFKDEYQMCGGSIISQRVILSAGHCFEEPNKPHLYKVGAGKLYRTYNDTRDAYAQYSKVKIINIENYVDAHFRGDIAVIILETPFSLTKYVRPVCFDGEEFREEKLTGKTGIVTGWGYTSETGKSSEVLKELTVNYFTRDDCSRHIRDDFEQYYEFDKICAGVLTKDENVCQGDSGGPLVFKHESLYYIRGIVSISASKPNAHCDSASLAFYTSISHHRRYIEKYVRLYKT